MKFAARSNPATTTITLFPLTIMWAKRGALWLGCSLGRECRTTTIAQEPQALGTGAHSSGLELTGPEGQAEQRMVHFVDENISI